VTRSRGIIVGFILLALSGILVTLTYKFVNFWMSPAVPSPAHTVFYEVKKNDTPLTVSKELAKLNVVSNAHFFYWYGRFTGKNQKIKAADYKFSTIMRPDDVFNVLMSGVSFGIPFTVPEGYNFKQIAALLDNIRIGSGERFLKLVQSPKLIKSLGLNPPSHTLEGYLFPETYLIGRKTPEEDIIRAMVKRTLSLFNSEIELRIQELGFTPYQVLTLASVIEKETGAPEERPKISSVFHNRIKKKMKLQSDPTVIYGIPNYAGNITKKDLLTRTSYNTYVIYGLPLGPIGNPGKSAIMAALFPEQTDYLFFVSQNDGRHVFTSTYADHQKAVNKFQVDRRAREGKSWRDLNKNQSH
jgi:UPF0755 protein